MKRVAAAAATLAVLATPAFGHTGEGLAGGFAGGFMHPLLGADHVAAMLAVGLWGAFRGSEAFRMARAPR